MFRLFLMNLIKAGDQTQENHPVSHPLPPRRLRNRRIYERFDIDYKHLSLMNEQDILLVRDLSETGFSTEVSERCFQRFHIGDVYQCRLRYLSEIFESQLRVIWKSNGFVGFELTEESSHLHHFMLRLLRPIAIGASMQRVDEKYTTTRDNEGMIWYHGTETTNFYIWLDDEAEVKSWRLEDKDQYIEWNDFDGLKTGRINAISPQSLESPWNPEFKADSHINPKLIQFATDVVMAMQVPNKDKIIESMQGDE